MLLKFLLMLPIAFLFMLLVRLKNALYDSGLLKQRALEKPVIAIGNLSFGGTGKSPMTVEIAQLLLARGLRVAILSRGYGRRNPKASLLVDCNGDWRDYGDEPLMLARRLPQVQVCVGPSRYAAAQVASHDVDVFLMDDGFQHRQLKRHVDLVLIDLKQPMPTWLPPFPFRETLAALKRADAAILTRWQAGQDTSRWDANIRAKAPHLPLLRAGFKPQGLFDLRGKAYDLAKLDGLKVGWFAGIAQPQKFAQTLQQLGAELGPSLALKDHEPLAPHRLKTFADECRMQGVSWIVTTEKDAAKLDPSADFAIVVVFLTIDVFWEDPDRIGLLVNHWLMAADSIR